MEGGVLGTAEEAPGPPAGQPPPVAARSDGVASGVAETGMAAAATEEEETEGQWSSRAAFWIAAMGSAVGFGNIWRFPFLVWDYGGLAFFVPWAIALCVIGVPITFLELGLGQLSRGGQSKAFGSLNIRGASLGWFVLCLVNVIYYPTLQDWSMLFFGYSFKKDLPWLVNEADTAACAALGTEVDCLLNQICRWDADTGECTAFALDKASWFFQRVLHAKPEYWEGVTHVSWEMLVIETGFWVLTYFATVAGARIIGYVNYFVAVAPAVFMIVQVGVAASLPGSIIGVKQYMGRFNGTTLQDPKVWADAASQTLFSLGATLGAMCAYASHNKKDQNFVQDAVVIVVGDTLFAVVAGFATFSVCGYLSFQSGIPLEDLPLSGRGLAFQTYPVGLGEGVPYPGGNILNALFFLTLALLQVSTCVGLVEATALVLTQSTLWHERKLKKWHAYAGVCGFCALFAFIDWTDLAMHMLDCADEFVATFSFIWIGGAQAICAGWFSATDLYYERAGRTAVLLHMSTWIVGGVAGSVLGFGLKPSLGSIVGPVVGAVICIGGWVWAIFLTPKEHPRTGEKYTCGGRMYNLMFYNIEQLREYMNDTSCKNSCWRVPTVWSGLIKYIVPMLCTMLFFQAVCNPYYTYKLPLSPGEDGPYYPVWIYVVGSIGPLLGVVGTLIFFFFPTLMRWLAPARLEEFPWPDPNNPVTAAKAAAKAAATKAGEGCSSYSAAASAVGASPLSNTVAPSSEEPFSPDVAAAEPAAAGQAASRG